MKKLSTTITLLLLALIGFAQTTVVDFENPAHYTYAAWDGTAEVVDNPLSDGLNASAKVGKYIIPAGKPWANAAVVILNNPLNYKDLGSLQFLVMAPSATKLYAKLELDGVGGVAQGEVYPVSESGWQMVSINFSAFDGVDTETATFDKFVFFFNVDDNIGGEEWYFDNISIVEKLDEPVAPTNLQISNITATEFTLTWDNDPNAVDGTNIFIAEPSEGTGDVYITTVGAGVNSYTYTGTYGAITIDADGVYTAKLQALPDNDHSAYADVAVDMTSLATALGDGQTAAQLTVYPNPVINELNINSEGAKCNRVQVYNSTGQLVKCLDHTSDIKLIPFTDMAQGVYFVQIRLTDSTVITKKIIKRK
ncbi:MAG: T9SS type A sorting domain-containing protein [Bacteroidales bacterium]|nr:T9SS type A sorting domain-containing protein [Bacteroidales bacterium]